MIELLVVISIVSFLASTAIYFINVARLKGRDSRRMEDLGQISKALEMYYDDHGQYPDMAADSRYDFGPVGSLEYIKSDWDNFSSALSPYMPNVPVDPVNIGPVANCPQCGEYFYNGTGGQKYILSTYIDLNEPDTSGQNVYGLFYSKTSANCNMSTFWLCN